MALFASEDKQHLYAIFQPEEHEYRVLRTVGKEVPHAWKKNEMVKEWAIYSVYIKRDAIIDRLNDKFFGEWSSGFLDPQTPCTYHKSHVDCAMHMTIRGVRMEYNGSQSGTGENAAKSAATDAFKRVASQWGIGLYLQHAPTIMTKNPDSLDKTGQKKAEQEVQRKIAEWVNSLLSGQSQKIIQFDGNQESDEYEGNSITDETPELSDADKNKWSASIKKLVMPLYVGSDGKENPFHMSGSLNKAFEEGTINYDMRPFVAALHMLAHRAKTDYGMEIENVQTALGGKVGEVVQETPQSFANAWSIIRSTAQAEAV